MNLTLSKLFLVFLLLFSMKLTFAQPRVGDFVNFSAGLGLTTANESNYYGGTGYYAQVEYVTCEKKWFGVRPYVGFVSTTGDDRDLKNRYTPYYAATSAVFFGGKVRVCAPIPYVAPFIECGLGFSIGNYQTYTPNRNIKMNGIDTHIPFSIGLSFGRKTTTDVMFSYYFNQKSHQVAGGAAIGFLIPIK